MGYSREKMAQLYRNDVSFRNGEKSRRALTSVYETLCAIGFFSERRRRRCRLKHLAESENLAEPSQTDIRSVTFLEKMNVL